MVNTKSRILIENTIDRNKSGWLDLPFSEDQLADFLESIGVTSEDEDEVDNYARLMAGEELIAKWAVVGHESDYLFDEHFEDIYAASDLVERIESLNDWEAETLEALIEDGDKLEDAVEIVEDGEASFYARTDLASLAEQFVDEGMFDKDYLMNFIDYDALGEALADDGYTEVNGGVLRRP